MNLVEFIYRGQVDNYSVGALKIVVEDSSRSIDDLLRIRPINTHVIL